MKEKLFALIKKYQQFLWLGIFLISFSGMLGSLYFSTFGDPVHNLIVGTIFPSSGGFAPCDLCWFSRILMYPMVPITAVAILTKDKNFTKYILALSIPGVLLSIYHYLIQKFPIATSAICSANNPCNAMEVNYLGFITIPLLALIAYILITLAAFANTWVNSPKKEK